MSESKNSDDTKSVQNVDNKMQTDEGIKIALLDDEYYKLTDEQIDKAIFSQENVDHFMMYQKTIELIGLIEQPDTKATVTKFLLVNKAVGDEKIKIEVLVFDETVRAKIKSLMLPGAIIHLDGLFVNSKYSTSKGNIKYDLVASSNTTFHLIKEAPKYTSSSSDVETLIETTIEDSVNHDGTICVIAYMKSRILIETIKNNYNRSEIEINKGCLSDCVKYKLEVRMPIVCDMTDFKPGFHVKVIGTVQYSKVGHPYLWVLQKGDIEVASNEVKEAGEYLKGTTMPKKIKKEADEQMAKKKRYQ